MRGPVGTTLGVAAIILVAVPPLAGAQGVVDPPGARRPVALTAPRVQPLPEAEWTDAQRQLVVRFTRDGKADNALKTLLRVPELVEAVMPYTTYLAAESSISPRHRQLLILRVAWLTGNEPLWATHAPRARAYGLDEAAVRRIAEGPEARWDRVDATLLRLVDQMFRNAAVNDATWRALTERYDLYNMMDAIETVNHFTTLGIFYNSLGVQADADLKDRLPGDVPYRVTVPARETLTAARVQPNEGRGIAVGRTFAKHPNLSQRWSPRQNFILRIGWNCQSEYEWSQHVGSVGRAREHGLEPVRIAEGAGSGAWDDFEKHILRAADELYRDAVVSDATWRGLAQQYRPDQIMAALYSSSVYRAISMSLNAYGVQLDDASDERLPKLRSEP